MAKQPQTKTVASGSFPVTFKNRVAKLERHIKAFPNDQIAIDALAKLKAAGPSGVARRSGYKRDGNTRQDRLMANILKQIDSLNKQMAYMQKSKYRVYILGDKMYTEPQLKEAGFHVVR